MMLALDSIHELHFKVCFILLLTDLSLTLDTFAGHFRKEAKIRTPCM